MTNSTAYHDVMREIEQIMRDLLDDAMRNERPGAPVSAQAGSQNPPGWQEVDGVKLPPIDWGTPVTGQDAVDAAHDHNHDLRKHGDA